MNTCKCGKLKDYGDLCRDCYEDKLRHEAIDAYDQNSNVVYRRYERKERCKVRPLNYYLNGDSD